MTAKVRTTIAPTRKEVRRAARMARDDAVLTAFPGLGTPSQKKILELAVTLGLKEIDREAKR